MLSKHDRYLDYNELTALLKEFQAKFPNFVAMESLGKSKQSREYWLLTLTDTSTGPHNSKPAFWVDGNTHASELAGAQACLHLIDKLLSEKDKSPRVRELLKNYTVYAFPRISVDGAELVLKTDNWVRSSVEIYPDHIPHEREKVQDIDGDGRIAQMRILDPSGSYKISKKDPRLMIKREPWDDVTEGPFYDLVEEGTHLNYDGFRRVSFVEEKFDLNRQSPASFKPTQSGAGPLPMFLDEGRIYAKAIVDRPNIFAINTFHTYGGVMLRPSSLRADSEMATQDLETFKIVGELGEKITGYKAFSVFHDFNYDPKAVTTGAWDDWHYDHRGIFSWTPEIWSVANQAGVQFEKPLDQYRKLNEDDLVKILQWCDKNLDSGTYYREWKKFTHPQIGAVELGGWDQKFIISNPPPKMLRDELEKLTEFCVKQILMGPQLEITRSELKHLDADVYQVKVEVRNNGFLPTYFTEQRKAHVAHKAPMVHVGLSNGQMLLQGKTETKLEHLQGRIRNMTWGSPVWGASSANPHEDQMLWIVKGKGRVEITVDYGGAGTMKCALTCE